MRKGAVHGAAELLAFALFAHADAQSRGVSRSGLW